MPPAPYKTDEQEQWQSPVSMNISLKKSVSFNNVEVREYDLDLCDNPSCSLGPAIGLGWKYDVALQDSLDGYEENRTDIRPKEQLKLSRELREEILNNSEFTNKEIRHYTLEKAKLANQRINTRANLGFEKYEEKLENLKRKAKKLLLRKDPDKELEKLWPGFCKKGHRRKRHSIS